MLDARLQDLQEAMPGAIATKNKTGFMSAELSEISKQYIEFSKNCNSVLDIGCAYGISVLPVLDLEKVTVHAVDLSGEHLKILQSKLTPNQNKYFIPNISNFPLETDFLPNAFDAIHAANVLHFIRGEHFNLALAHCFKWLKPGGKIFVTLCSLYLPHYANFIGTYQKRKQDKIRWPGEIENIQHYMPEDAPEAEKRSGVEYLHIFTKEDLAEKFEEVGFNIEQSIYFTFEHYQHLKYADDSRSFVGIIATKPSDHFI